MIQNVVNFYMSGVFMCSFNAIINMSVCIIVMVFARKMMREKQVPVEISVDLFFTTSICRLWIEAFEKGSRKSCCKNNERIG